MYGIIVTFRLNEDNIRISFTELLEEWGFEKRREMSTYGLNKRKAMSDMEFIDGIVGWSKTIQGKSGERFGKDDFIEVYIAGMNSEGKAEIRAHSFIYDKETDVLQ